MQNQSVEKENLANKFNSYQISNHSERANQNRRNKNSSYGNSETNENILQKEVQHDLVHLQNMHDEIIRNSQMERLTKRQIDKDDPKHKSQSYAVEDTRPSKILDHK